MSRAENVAVEYRWADGQYDRLPALAAELVRRQVTVIRGRPRPAHSRRQVCNHDIPIVFAIGGDPVRAGLVASLNRPGGNITGINFVTTGLAKDSNSCMN